MKAVAGVKYLYLRKQWFYFRMRLPKRLGLREIRLALGTENLSKALSIIESFNQYIKQLKQLVITSNSMETNQSKAVLFRIRDDMLKQLSVGDIDGAMITTTD